MLANCLCNRTYSSQTILHDGDDGIGRDRQLGAVETWARSATRCEAASVHPVLGKFTVEMRPRNKNLPHDSRNTAVGLDGGRYIEYHRQAVL
jgi:hypothetical protein